ncbi:hypothetical protein AC578_4634 [Pseudocercospora eumusae]|uniref:Uncharacterized protein n=1 Tax=Pseudocercospora eumusae TaxID=321146 RepID=A0A139GZE2_9PEZI|nr:hypothetical protein AC578_4634 [Pseudocercospora eumusae]
MPKLKTITFACEVGRRKITARQILARASIADLTCTNIGVFQLGGELSHDPNLEERICNTVATKNPHIWIVLHGGAEALQNGFMQHRIEHLRGRGHEMAAQIYESMSSLASIFEIATHEGIGLRLRELNGTRSMVPIDVLDCNSDPELLE